MEEEEKKPENKPEEEKLPEGAELNITAKPGGVLNKKIFLFGLPLFIIQVIIIYFITANFLLSKMQMQNTEVKKPEPDSVKTEEIKKPVIKEPGKYIYSIEDIIVNPAGTEGKRLLLASVGFDLMEEEDFKELKNKEIVIKDIIVTALSSKSLEQLNEPSFKDSIKTEFFIKAQRTFPNVKLNSVYISKFIIQ